MEPKITLPFWPCVKLDVENIQIIIKGDWKIMKVGENLSSCYNL